MTALGLNGPVFLELLANPELAVRVAVILARRPSRDRRTLAAEATASVTA